jgi:glyoxylase-like metal-dependent hydrolase (beta-lactamase superfamily II)
MVIKVFEFNPFAENTYVLSDAQKNAIIIDPGCYEAHERAELHDYVTKQNLTVRAVVNTHCHIDHVLGNEAMKVKYNVDLWVPKNEKVVLHAIPSYAPNYGFADYRESEVEHWFEEGLLSFGEIKLKAIEVPGHSPGHMVFYDEKNKVLIGGDVLFRQSIGRTDLPGGNHEQLLTNIKSKVYTLPDEVVVYPGHGPETTIGFEKQHNPFVRA